MAEKQKEVAQKYRELNQRECNLLFHLKEAHLFQTLTLLDFCVLSTAHRMMRHIKCTHQFLSAICAMQQILFITDSIVHLFKTRKFGCSCCCCYYNFGYVSHDDTHPL